MIDFCRAPHPTNEGDRCARLADHPGDYRGYVFSIATPEEWPAVAINDRFPAPFEGLDYKTSRDIFAEAIYRTAGHYDLITEELLWDIRNCDIFRSSDQDASNA